MDASSPPSTCSGSPEDLSPCSSAASQRTTSASEPSSTSAGRCYWPPPGLAGKGSGSSPILNPTISHSRIGRRSLRLLERLFPQNEHVLKINELDTTNDVVEAARSTLVIGTTT